MAMARPRFRPDIEGLRGIAILLVVLFHAGVPLVGGGFVGVDVFFVLSGFFITGVLVRLQSETGTIDLAEFYGHRALRLLPVLLVVLLVSLAAMMWLYAPIDRAAIAATAGSVARSSANIEFAGKSVNYFSTGENPLLHTWSLSVEQQFYLVWPLLFLVAALVVKREDRRPLLIGMGVAGAASIVASVIMTGTSQSWAFFGMPTRIWEFALGGLLALVLNPARDRTSAAATGVQVAGLVAIGLGAALYSRTTPYPGWAALLPAFGACALLVGGQRAPDSPVSRALSIAPLRWLGRMSYAWYLWHWPLVGIGGVLDPALGVGGKLLWSAAGLVLAWLTFRFIEEPARTRLAIPRPWLLPAAFVASGIAALIAHGAMLAAEWQAARPDQRMFAAAREDRMRHDCWATTIDDPRGACEFGDVSAATTVVLFGDSHAEHWLGALDRIGRERGWKIVALVKGGCPVADVPESENQRGSKNYHECMRYREAMVQRIVAMRPAAVILSSWDHYVPVNGRPGHWQVSVGTWQRGLHRTYARVSGAGIPTVALRGTPRTWFDVPACLSRRAAGLPLAGDCSYDRDGSLSPAVYAAQTSAAQGLDVRFVDMNDQICASRRCAPVRGGVVVFTDDNHLTATFSRSVAPALEARLDTALAPGGHRLP
ncbi:MAG: acyltransferase 3 [Gemmatimonadetes bacterium]|nr:acyltransferase 3 [Gemmatimonadota bacterium]